MVPELCSFALVINARATSVYTVESAVLWDRTHFPFEEEHVMWILLALPAGACSWAGWCSEGIRVGVILPWSSSGSLRDESPLCLCVFFKISSLKRCSSLFRQVFCLRCFFWAGTHFMQTLEVTNRASSGIVLKMKSMFFNNRNASCYLNWFGFLVLIMRMNYMLHYDKLILF